MFEAFYLHEQIYDTDRLLEQLMQNAEAELLSVGSRLSGLGVQVAEDDLEQAHANDKMQTIQRHRGDKPVQPG